MKYLITKRDMEISHIIQGQIIKIGKVIEITNNIRIIDLTNGNITKTMDFSKTTQSVLLS
jgi:hypothetical protein